jgi:FixJ family two-component response regulator
MFRWRALPLHPELGCGMTTMDGPTVFIVDDEPVARDSIQELLESVGLRAEVFASGQACVNAIGPSRSGCLVLDVCMAGISGLAQQEKLNEFGFNLPVITLTAHGDVPMAVRAMRAGARDVMQKPYRDSNLLASINEALKSCAPISS